MSVTTSTTLTVPAVGATSSVNTSATAGSGLAANGFVGLSDGVNYVIGVLYAVASGSVSFLCLEVRQGAAGNTLASGAKVVAAANPGEALASGLGDIDWATYASGKVLTATASGGKPYSWQTPDTSAGTVTAVTGAVGVLSSGGTTPAISLASYAPAGTAAASTLHEVSGTVTAAGASTTLTLAGAAQFASANFTVVVWDCTALAPATVTAQSASAVTFTSTSTHVYAYSLKGA